MPGAIVLSIKKLFNTIAYGLSQIDTSKVSESTERRTLMEKAKVRLKTFGDKHTTKFFTEKQLEGDKTVPLSVSYSELETTTNEDGGIETKVTGRTYDPRFISKSEHAKFAKKRREAFGESAKLAALKVFSDTARTAVNVTQQAATIRVK